MLALKQALNIGTGTDYIVTNQDLQLSIIQNS
jgi:hypothetical protein